MSVISSPSPRNQYTANGAQTGFSYTFEIPTTSDIAVYVNSTLQTLTSHYTVSGAGTDNGGTVTFVSPPANGAKVTLIRNMSLSRATDYQSAGPLYAETLNLDIDRLWMGLQQTNEKFQRTILAPPYTTTIDLSADSFQPVDATLTAIAGASTGANKLHYFTGTDTVGVADLTSFARTILDDADGSAVRTTIGAAASSHSHAISDVTGLQTALDGKQGLDATLTALAGTSTSANKLIYFSNTDTTATTDLTSFGRSLIDDADASAARTTLSLGTIATQAANNVTIAGGSISGITDLAVADGGTGASDASGARTNLGLVIGTNVQAYDALLGSIAGLTFGSDSFIYGTGSDTAAAGTITSFGRSLIDDTDASAARTTLGAAAASHSHAQSDITNLTSDLAAKAPTSRTISAGAGLTGGGDLTANRTLSLDIDGLSLEGSLDNDNDMLVIWDESAETYKKVTIGSVSSAGASGVSSFNGRTGSVSPTSGDYAVADITGLQTALDGKQGLDGELTALAGLTSAANALPYFTGSGTATTTTLSAYGRSLIDDADAAAARTTLGLGTMATEASSSYQPIDSDLTAIAGLSSSGLIARTGSGTAAARTITQGNGISVTNGDGGSGNPTIAADFGSSAAALAASASGGAANTVSRSDHAHQRQLESFVIPCSDLTTSLTTGTNVASFRMPYAFTITAVKAAVHTVSSSGVVTVDINEAGSTILSTKLSIDASEETSATAATAAVISDTALADDAKITIDIDAAGTGAKGLTVTIIGRQSA